MTVLDRFARDARGGVALALGIVAPVLIGAAGLAVDYGRYTRTVADLQALADSSAVAAVSSLSVANMTASSVGASVEGYVNKSASNTAWQKGENGISVETVISPEGDAVKVTLTQEWEPMIAHVLTNITTPVSISSTARLVGSGKVCVLAMETTEDKAIHMDDAAKLTGKDCGVLSNSVSSAGIMIDKAANLQASLICSAGGANVKKKGYTYPAVTEDCPALMDPLAGRVTPSVGACDHNGFVADGSAAVTLMPGVYCGGLTLTDTVAATLTAGTYVIKDGPLVLSGAASMTGTDVGFFLTGSGSTMELQAGTSVSVEAPTSGEMAGLLFFEDRGNAPVIHQINSSDAKNLLGTIYLPKSILKIAAAANVAGDSAYTALIVRKLQVFEGPNVTLNSNYDATNVPVPPGLLGGKVVLTN